MCSYAFLVLSFGFVTGADVSTTTKVYDLDVPGSSPIRIVEGESLWPTSRFEHRAFTTSSTQTNLNYPFDDGHSVALQEFLNNYAAKVKADKAEEKPQLESVDLITADNPEEKSKSWNLMHYQKHKHPYEDKKGWVSLEPVPWSISKISKWQPNVKPVSKPWNEFSSNDRPWDDFPDTQDHAAFNIRPQRPKPSYEIETGNNYFNRHKTPIKITGLYKDNEEDCQGEDRNDIITDGLPPNFPTAIRDSFKRRGGEIHPESHPSNGDGEWVLLSTTKGYKYPKNRQRSLEIKPQSVGVHRAVRLTVLPPLKNSKVNMTTSHGGLLQVESTFETVDQAQKKFAKKQRQKQKKKQNRRPQKKPLLKQVVVPTSVTSIPRRNTSPDSSAVLAAVGAGMIPATMAMLVPMAMNGRRKRDTTSHPYSNIEITLPRYIQT